MCRLENGFSVRCQAWYKGIVCVHPDFFQQRRCTKIRNDKERHFLDGSIHHELEHTFQGNPSTADGLEYRRKSGRGGFKLSQETLGKGAYAIKAFKSAIRRIDSGAFVPEKFFLTEQSGHLIGLSSTKGIDKRQVWSVHSDILGHILIESLQVTGLANRKVRLFR